MIKKKTLAEKPLVSIITPLYNYSKYIEENIKSVLSQYYSNIEHIIVDDCSTDNPYAKIQQYCGDGSKVKYIKLDKNSGYSVAKNIGIINCKGQYIAILDADDMLTKTSVKSRIEGIYGTAYRWIHGPAYILENRRMRYDISRDNLIKRIIKSKKYALYYKGIHAQTVLVTRDFYKIYGLYDESLRHSSDREMWRRALAFGDIPKYIQDPVCVYRIHPGQMHNSKNKLDTKKEVNEEIEEKIRIKLKEGINANNTKLWE